MPADPRRATTEDRPAGGSSSYLVVARRYRPQAFDELIGQETIAAALSNAIRTHRVGHAYLFTGARGVGKTSTARILAKALNCIHGPTPQPCNECDICQAVATGEDVDVLEIDGASNRGIDEIRQLRSTVGIRPSRARYKIFIIDEVHMLTKEAFNALLKTLEEPPEHVKFVFCTTDPEKIPVTVLSRCQRFDFPPIGSGQIMERLATIVRAEGRGAEDEALRLIARRAAGSLRDSQSLLEQVLAVGSDTVTIDQVHQVLGTATNSRLQNLVAALRARKSGEALRELDKALADGVDAGPLTGQLVGYLRDLLTLAVGGDPSLLSTIDEVEVKAAAQWAEQWGTETLLAALQVLDQALVRMRQSLHPRVLLEIALVRICRLEDLDALDQLIHSVQQAGSGGKKKLPSPPALLEAAPVVEANRPRSSLQADPSDGGIAASLTADADGSQAGSAVPPGTEAMDVPPMEDPHELWRQATGLMDGLLADCAARASHVAIRAPNVLVVTFPADYNTNKAFCERADRRQAIEAAVARVCGGRSMRLELQTVEAHGRETTPPPPVSVRELLREVEVHPWVQQACELMSMEVSEVMTDPARNRPR